jgi:hypothetical protein
MMIRSPLLASLALLACGDPGPTSVGDPLDDPQLPPRGSTDIISWLEAASYQTWRCEPEPHDARPGSPHGRNRICSNDALAASTEGPFPVGAAGVKEIFEGETISLYAVYRKVAGGEGGNTWYWFEGARGEVIANGEGDDTCTGCHGTAPRDFVFTIVP